MFDIRPDGFEHEIEFVGTVDLARYAVGHVGPDELGFGEVMEPVNALRVEVLQPGNRARWVLRLRELEHSAQSHIIASVANSQASFRNCYTVLTASPPMAPPPDDMIGEIAVVLDRGQHLVFSR